MNQYIFCSEVGQAKAYRYARAENDKQSCFDVRGSPLRDLAGPMHVPSSGGNPYVMIVVGDYGRIKMTKFLR